MPGACARLPRAAVCRCAGSRLRRSSLFRLFLAPHRDPARPLDIAVVTAPSSRSVPSPLASASEEHVERYYDCRGPPVSSAPGNSARTANRFGKLGPNRHGKRGPQRVHAAELATGPKFNETATAVITMMMATKIRTLIARAGLAQTSDACSRPREHRVEAEPVRMNWGSSHDLADIQ